MLFTFGKLRIENFVKLQVIVIMHVGHGECLCKCNREWSMVNVVRRKSSVVSRFYPTIHVSRLTNKAKRIVAVQECDATDDDKDY